MLLKEIIVIREFQYFELVVTDDCKFHTRFRMYKMMQGFHTDIVINDDNRLLCAFIYLLICDISLERLSVKNKYLFVLDSFIKQFNDKEA